MTTYLARGYKPADLPYAIELARLGVAERDVRPYYYHPGDDVWGFAGYGETEDIRVWFDDRGLAGWVALEPPVRFAMNIRGGVESLPGLATEMVDWAEARIASEYALPSQESLPKAYSMLGERTLSVDVRDSDTGRIAFLEARGYRKVDRGGYRFSQPLDAGLPAANVPPGYTLRHVTERDLDERVDLHRDAWSVWGSSKFSREAYEKLRRAPLYDTELDVVLEAPDGHLVSYCICWADDVTGVGNFEPVGTRPAYAGKGLGRETIREGLRRLRDRGMHTATVGTASVNEPAARLYRSAGFQLLEMEHMYTKDLS